MKIADDIIKAVCADHGIATEQLLQSGFRTKKIFNARTDAIHRLHEQGFSGRAIAGFLYLSESSVGLRLYPSVRLAQRRGKAAYEARQRAMREARP